MIPRLIADVFSAPSRFPGGAVLFRQNDAVRALYLIEDGVVRLTRSELGREFLIGLRTGGSLVGATAALLARPQPLAATTLGECLLRQVPAATLINEYLDDPDVGLWLCKMQARDAVDHLATLGVFGLSQPRLRLERLLMRLQMACGVPCADGSIRLMSPLTHEQYAEAIGASREHVTRLLGQLCREGWLRRSGGWLIVPKTSPLLRAERAMTA